MLSDIEPGQVWRHIGFEEKYGTVPATGLRVRILRRAESGDKWICDYPDSPEKGERTYANTPFKGYELEASATSPCPQTGATETQGAGWRMTHPPVAEARRNAYMVRTKDARSYTIPLLDDGTGPEEPCWPMAPVVAESRAQAKHLFLSEFAGGRNRGVYDDDWNDLRVTLLAKGVSYQAGVREDDEALWMIYSATPASTTGDRNSGHPRT